ncbi:hypothetical protein AMTRI_Chr11g99800 [Amborella trichopoda]
MASSRKRGGFKIPASFCYFRLRRSNGLFQLRGFGSLKENVGRALCWFQLALVLILAIDGCIEFINSKAYLETGDSVFERSRLVRP